MSAHSEKGLATIALMGTTAEQWALTPIRWVKETRMVGQEQTCPTCHGDRAVLYNAEQQMIPRPERVAYPDGDKLDWTDEAAANEIYGAQWAAYRQGEKAIAEYRAELRRQHGDYASLGNCPTCIRKRNGWRTGKALVPTPTEVMVGYPEWLPGVRFDSRFGVITTERYCCALCSKTISKSGMVPVQARGADERAHGMWVGEDCAAKIFGLSRKLKKNEMIEPPSPSAS